MRKSIWSGFPEAELCEEKRHSRAAGWSEGRPFLLEEAHKTQSCIRVLKDGGQGLVTTPSLSLKDMPLLLKKGATMANYVPKDPFRQLVKTRYPYPSPIPTDKNLFSTSSGDILIELEEVEKEILKLDPRIKKVIRMVLRLEKSQYSLKNSHELNLDKEHTEASFLVEILAEADNLSEVAWDITSSRFYERLNWRAIAVKAARKAVESLGGRPLPSGAYTVLLPPRVAIQFLSLISVALSAEEVYLGRSFLTNRLNQPIADERVSIQDHPFLEFGVASESFDDEGVPHRIMDVIEDGILKNYFYDLKSALRAERESTGHGFRPSLASPPRPHHTNLFINPGALSQDALLNSSDKVFWVEDVMGLHMADPLTGEFSLGASGSFYERGQFQHPVRGVTLAGQIGELLKNVKGIGTDLSWYGQLGSPSLLVSHVVISGN